MAVFLYTNKFMTVQQKNKDFHFNILIMRTHYLINVLGKMYISQKTLKLPYFNKKKLIKIMALKKKPVKNSLLTIVKRYIYITSLYGRASGSPCS